MSVRGHRKAEDARREPSLRALTGKEDHKAEFGTLGNEMAKKIQDSVDT